MRRPQKKLLVRAKVATATFPHQVQGKRRVYRAVRVVLKTGEAFLAPIYKQAEQPEGTAVFHDLLRSSFDVAGTAAQPLPGQMGDAGVGQAVDGRKGKMLQAAHFAAGPGITVFFAEGGDGAADPVQGGGG